MSDPEAKLTAVGAAMPAIEECPNCGSHRLHGVEISRDAVTITLDGVGGVKTINRDEILETAYSTLFCLDCNEDIIFDGEVVV